MNMFGNGPFYMMIRSDGFFFELGTAPRFYASLKQASLIAFPNSIQIPILIPQPPQNGLCVLGPISNLLVVSRIFSAFRGALSLVRNRHQAVTVT